MTARCCVLNRCPTADNAMDPVYSVCMTAAVDVAFVFAFIDLSRAYKDSAEFVYMYIGSFVFIVIYLTIEMAN